MTTRELLGKIIARKSRFNFIYGSRGDGKTYSLIKLALKEGVKKGKVSLFIVRYKSALNAFKQSVLTAVSVLNCLDDDEKLKIKLKGNNLLFNGENIIIFKTITMCDSEKGKMYNPNGYMVVYDEIDTLTGRFCKNEINIFLDALESFFRGKKWRCFLLSNSIQKNNIYLSFFKIKNIPENRIITYRKKSLTYISFTEGFINKPKLNKNKDFLKYFIDESYKNYTFNITKNYPSGIIPYLNLSQFKLLNAYFLFFCDKNDNFYIKELTKKKKKIKLYNLSDDKEGVKFSIFYSTSVGKLFLRVLRENKIICLDAKSEELLQIV